ncbi:hypothetical protein ACHQM5_028104 [Ranunculus cassubicifolius]
MEALRKVTILFFMLAIVFGNEVIGSNGLICGMQEEGLMSCKPSVSGPKPSPPSKECCSTLSVADFDCMCKFKDAMPSLGIDPKLAFRLPKKCKLNKKFKC